MTQRARVLVLLWVSLFACTSEVGSDAEEPEVSATSQALALLSGSPKGPCNRTDGPCVDMYFGAHPDDDLLFMNPDVMNSIRAGNRVIVLVKNGGSRSATDPERNEEARYWLNRERGILNAYAYMARGDSAAIPANSLALSANGRIIPSQFRRVVTAPERDAFVVGGLKLPRFDIQATGGNLVTVMFLRVADGGTANLWLDPSSTTQVPIQDCPSTNDCAGGTGLSGQYVTRQKLLDFYKALMETFRVTSVSVLDSTDLNVDGGGGPGDYEGFTDNDEHIYTAKFALAAAALVQAGTTRSISVRSSRGYSLDLEEPNLATGQPEQTDKQRAFLYYAMFDQAALYPSVGGAPSGLCEPNATCASDPNQPGTEAKGPTTNNRMTGLIPFNYSDTYFSSPNSHVNPIFYGSDAWQSRKATTRTLLGAEPLQGRIQNGNGSCLGVSGTAPAFVGCANAPSWTITKDNRIRAAIRGQSYCLTVSQVANPPASTPESVTFSACNATDGSQTLFMFANGQIRTPQARCLVATDRGGLRSDDCRHSYVSIPRTSPVATTSYPGYPASFAIDASSASRWSSAYSDAESITFDLGASKTITHVRLNWETAYGRDYQIQLSDNGSTWATCPGCEVTNGDGGIDDVVLTQPTVGRYVRMQGIHRGTPWGYSLWDIAVLRAAGTPEPLQDWTLLFGGLQLATTQWSDTTTVDDHDYYYQTLSIVNRNLCLRWSAGNYCAPWTSGLSVGPAVLGPTDYADQFGWANAATGSTVRSVWTGPDNANGNTIACGRGYYGVSCTNGLWTADYSTTNGWDAPIYAQAIRYPDLFQDGHVHVCGRGYYGISCALNQGSSLAPIVLLTEQFSNSRGWDDLSNASTIQFGDINGDGRLDVCGRSDAGIRCAAMTNDSAVYINGRDWSFDTDRTVGIQRDFADNDPIVNWSSSSIYYGTIRLADINRDGLADVCGRGPLGLYCAFSTGTGFEAKRLVLPDLSDAAAWGNATTGGTLSFGDLNGNKRMDLCARGIGGVYCAEGY